jgi:hypothetical protein
MEIRKTLCLLTAALAFGIGGCDNTKHEAVTFHEEGCSFSNYYFSFKGDELVSVDAPCVENLNTRTCLYTPGNKEQCKASGPSKEKSPEAIEKYLWIYENGEKW